MKTLVLALLCITACFADDSTSFIEPSTASFSTGPSTSMEPTPESSTSVAPDVKSTSTDAPVSTQMESSSMSPSVSPSHSMMPSSASMSPSMSISPSASTSTVPASSRVPTTNPPTTNPTTTPPKPYNVDVQVTDGSGKPCLWFKANVNVTYQTNNESGTIMLMGKDATADGTCSDLNKLNETSEITLTWKNEKISSMTVQFMTGSKNNWFFSKIGVVLDVPLSANGQVTAEATFKGDENTEFMHASQNKSYSCVIAEKVKLESKQNANVTVHLGDIMVQPFTNNNTPVSSKDTDSCSSKSKTSKSSSIVPIAVGCALAGLIVIVLIAYLIGRRKNDGRGYQQV